MASQSYDLLVLGDDFAGLVAACLCASRGMRVLLAETGEHRERYCLGKETLPSRSFSFHGGNSAALHRLVEDLNFHHQFKRRLHPLSGPAQILLPKRYLDISPDHKALAGSLRLSERELEQWLFRPGEELMPDLDAVLAKDLCIPANGFWEKREVSKEFTRINEACESWQEQERSDEETQIAEACAMANCDSTEVSGMARARHLSALQEGLSTSAGGWHEWREIFYEKFAAHGGELRSVDVQELELGWGKVTGLRTLEDHYSFNYCIAATPVASLLPWLEAKPAKKIASVAAQITPGAFRYTLNLIVGSQVVPEGLSETAFSVLDPDKGPLSGNLATISVRDAQSPGTRILTLEGLAPADDDGSPQLEGMRRALIDHAGQRLPFLSQHILHADSPHEPPVAKAPKRDLAEPISPRALWHSTAPESLGMQNLGYSLGIKHLSIASSQTLPELGLEGQIIAGLSAAKIATESIGIKKSSKSPSVLGQS